MHLMIYRRYLNGMSKPLGGVLDVTAVIPGKVYHPRDGYISYERFWCIDEKKEVRQKNISR